MSVPRSASNPQLLVVVYHYVRDLPKTRFPRLKGLLTDRFRDQVERLSMTFEMASLESALAFLNRTYRPTRHLCLLTFDDGLKDHHVDVLPILSERRIQGVFFVTTACFAGYVAGVHKIHFLLASLGLDQYRRAFLEELQRCDAEAATDVDPREAARIYRWDPPAVAAFKYLLNFQLPTALRDQVVDRVFAEHCGDEAAFARDLYLSWDEARELQRAGMTIGGHSHRHALLARLESGEQQADVEMCARELRAEFADQPAWPFSYPYGGFNDATVDAVRGAGFDCSFSVEVGLNEGGADPFQIRRLDTNDVRLDALDIA